MTNHWRDFKNSDVILVIGANPAENHPCGWKWAHVGRDERGTKIIHVDPRFTRTSAIADLYAPEKMPDDLRHAHERNDETLERIYIGRRFRNDTERLEKLFELYTKMTSAQAKTKGAVRAR